MGQKIALIIGNSDYQDPNLARLVTPQEDVNDLAEVLRASNVGGFDHVTTLINESDANVRLGIEDFFTDKKPDDLLVMYFSGHGVRDEEGKLYLAVNNTRPSRLLATAVPAEFITSLMDRSRSRRQVLILDCCHSGAFAQGAKAVTGESAGTGPAFEGSGYGRVVLTATDATQYAWEGDRVIGQADNSVFTHFMIQGLQTGEADRDADGRITLDELYDYVYEQVVAQTPKQTPGKWSYRQQGDIVIARNPVPQIAKHAELPSEIRGAVESSLPSVREAVVGDLAKILAGSNVALAATALETLRQLANDDSRRVSNVAAAALEALVQKRTTADGSANAGQEAAWKAEAEHLSREKVEEERTAKEKLEAERRAAQQVEAERLSREKAEQEHTAKEKTEAERLAVQQADRVGREKAEAEKHKGSTGVEITCEKPWYSFIPGYDVTCKIESTLGKTNIKLTLGNTQFIDLQPDVQYHLALSLEWARISGEGAADTTFTLAKGEILKLSYRSPIISGAGTKLVVKGRSLQK